MADDLKKDPNYKKIAQGVDFSIGVDDEFRERLINELRTFPNIFLICGDEIAASHTIQVGTNKEDLARAIISIMKKHHNVKAFIEHCLKAAVR